MEDPADRSDFVFLDAQVYEGNSFNYANTAFRSLIEQLESKRLRLVTTDITVRETMAGIEKNLKRDLAQVRKSVKDARVLRNCDLPDVGTALAALDVDKIVAHVQKGFTDFLAKHKAHVIDTSTQPAGDVFTKYFTETPPFGTGDKKAEFPDAFALQALLEWCQDNNEELFVVSGDKPIRDACKEHANLFSMESLAQLLDHVTADKKLAEFIRSEVMKRSEEIGKRAAHDFQDRMYNIDEENGDVEIEVESVKVDGEPDILDVSQHQGIVEMRFEVNFLAHLSYDDSDTGTYDHEDKRMVFMKHVNETQNKTEELVVEVRVGFDEIDPAGFNIDNVQLTSPDESYSFSTSKWDGYPWK
jgi:predicted nucleic acid-binding protein